MLFDLLSQSSHSSSDQPCRVKICGLRDLAMTQTTLDAGADAIGLMFYQPSPRCVEVEIAHQIAQLAQGRASVVGVFVNPAEDWLMRVLSSVRLDALQFHGEEDNGFCRSLGLPYIKALRLRCGDDLPLAENRWSDARAFLVDSYHPDAYGGTGETCDWALIPQHVNRPLMLAGGLRPGTVKSAIGQVKPWCVDVSSGVESAKGIKDATLIKAFISEVHNGAKC